jgi:hypothetical protein
MPHGISLQFSDQIADKFYQKVTATDPYDPSGLLANNVKGKPAFLAFYKDT